MPGIIEDWRELGCPKPHSRTGDQAVLTPENVGKDVKWTRPPDESPNALFGSTLPGVSVLHEKPWHRRAQELSLQGYPHVEIASMLGKSREMVATVLRQPWARERMNERMKEDASAQIKAFLEEECLPSLQRIKRMATGEVVGSKPSDMNAANFYLTDRFLGKATQPIASVDAKPVTELTNDELNSQVQGLVAGMATAPEDVKKP